MFQDSAGTTPVTAVEQPVGKILDKSGRGNHATQSTSTKRPVLSARYNLLTKTESLSESPWAKLNTLVSSQTVSDPLGGTTAATVTAISTSGYFYYSGSPNNPTNGSVVNRFWIRRRTGSGTVSMRTNALLGIDTAITITTTWTQLSITCVAGGATNDCFVLLLATSGDAVDIWHPELIQSDQASLPYQRVNTATDYNAVGYKPYLKFDGVDDALATGSIDFTSTDKMTVWAGVRRPQSAGMVCELSVNQNVNSGAFMVYNDPTGIIGFTSKGTIGANANDTVGDIVVTKVVTGIGSISSPVATIRDNGIQVATNTTTQGTGNYGNYPLYIGSRAGTSLPFNGQLYSLIVRGTQSTTPQVTNTETYVNGKTGAY
jgi:hypothetical protein